MASQPSVVVAPALKPDSLYFAYGSNLWLVQMATRCPESRYIGIGRLAGYKFQINERGYANVVPSRLDHVYGLCYLLSADDEQDLDLNEGVPWAYEKKILNIELFTARPTVVGRAVDEIIDFGLMPGPPLLVESRTTGNHASEIIEVLVYMSTKHVKDGKPRTEYIDRMNHGIRDAISMGISWRYIETCVRPLIPATAVRSA
jgi:gamma-glutamylcyclotransferase